MKYGMPTLVECKGIEECAALAYECGLDFIEINMSFPQYLPEALNVIRLREIMKEKHLFYTIHADEQLNPFDFNPKVSACYFDVMRDTIRFAKTLDIPVINIHLLKGVYVTLPGQVILLTDVYSDKYMARVRDFIAMCEEEIGDAELKICIENVDSNPFTESQIKALDLFMSSDKFALTLDTGHELCLDFKDTFVFEKYPTKLFHMHLHDAKGKSAHLPLGAADVEIEKKLSLLPKDRTCLIEVKTSDGLKQSVQELKKQSFLMRDNFDG